MGDTGSQGTVPTRIVVQSGDGGFNEKAAFLPKSEGETSVDGW